MRDEHDGRPMPTVPPSAKSARNVLPLHRDVEGRCRLVGDDQCRFAHEHHRDRGSLPHATRELWRLAGAASRVGEPYRGKPVDRTPACLAPAEAAVQQTDLRDLRTRREGRG